jgi:DNA-binding NtrC family response regulator
MTDGGQDGEAAEVVAGRFVARIEVPPLRDRLEDIPCLVEAFIGKHSTETPVRCSPEVLQALARLDWPWNVRQLENLVRGVLVRRHRGDICLADLPPACLMGARQRRLTRIEQVERDAIVAGLRTAGNKAEAARFLGISRATLYRKIRTYGISLERLAL